MAFRALSSIWARVKRERACIGLVGFYLFRFATWIPVVAVFNNCVGEVVCVYGPSMYPFLNAEKDQTTRGDIVVNYKYNAQYDLKRGMIVTFWNPFIPERTTVKRIVGVPGDVIRTRNPYPVPTVRVPPGHIWVEGDGDERDSQDSNTYGPIAAGLVIGKVTHILWPLHRSGKVRWWEYAEKIRDQR
ncbi:mitochondrial inner membrane protease subunit 2 [Biscogniauxia marginata]|nr:mitochondrial inner membrane protease subunit 2 [Biscogniauxia marginata]